jgi:hypothetical protein
MQLDEFETGDGAQYGLCRVHGAGDARMPVERHTRGKEQPSVPINPTTEFADKFRVIAMDQRNAGGQSRAPITAQDGWDSYTAEPLKRGHQDVVPLGRK